MPNPADVHTGHQRGDRRPDVGIQAEMARRPRPRSSRCRASTATWRSTARRSSTPAQTTTCSLSTPRPATLPWETQIVDFRKNAAQETSGPLIANGKIISTRGCEPKGGPEACVITAHDAKTGKELWRTRTIPRPGEPGNETWGDIPYENRWHVGAWMVPSYDPELNLLYVGTSVTSPAPKFMLAGNDKTVSLSQLHAGPERRHRRDRLVLPAHRRSLGFRSPI